MPTTKTGPGYVYCECTDRRVCDICDGEGVYLEARCAACGAMWPAKDMQKVGDDLFGDCCHQRCQDCDADATQMHDGDSVCDECYRERKVCDAIEQPPEVDFTLVMDIVKDFEREAR